MANRVKFESKNGTAEAEISEPSGAAKAPVLLLIQEWWGVNDHIRSLLDRFAAAGFITIAPDLFHGKTTKKAEEAVQFMQTLDRPRALTEIVAAGQYGLTLPRSNGKVGIVGFCMGGAFALATTTVMSNLSAAVAFYGLPPLDQTDFSKTTAPVLGHYASRDQHATVDGAKKVQSAIQATGHSMELHVYDADHAFLNDTRPEVFSPDSAKLSWERTIAFLHKHLG